MKITGIIAEYNPFHNGHKYQIDKVKENSDAVVIVMSGSFVQRGEIAVTDKWTRAEWALLNGADLVIELPVCYALNTAQKFAYGAVSIFNSMHVIDEICFGSECGDTDILKNAAEILENEPPEVSEKIKKLTSSGKSYPTAREEAFSDLIEQSLLNNPNNILAIEYIRSLMRLGSKIKPVTLKRFGAGYNDTSLLSGFASASGIRKLIYGEKNYSKFIPSNCVIDDIYDPKALDAAIISNLRMMDCDKLKNINEVSEGLENRILKAAMQVKSADSLAELIKTKRYTMSRIKRILISSLLGIEKHDYEINYLRVLGMTKTGAQILKTVKKNSCIDIVTKTADYKNDDILFKTDIRATDIAALCSKNKFLGGMDYFKSPVIL